MKKSMMFIFVFGMSFIGCDKENENAVPPCIQEQLAVFESTQACPSGAHVDKYSFQNQIVYAFNPGNCGADLTTDIFSESCNNLGFLGGIAGNTDINGVNFDNNATWESVIWSN